MSPGKRSRREFLKLTGAAMAAGSTITVLEARPAPWQVSPNDRIGLGVIGAGIQGMGDTRAALLTPGVELVAVADVYEGRLIRSKELWGDHLFTTRDYRELLARREVDAVLVATPDHWHARMAIEAMKAGKDVYVEKPMVQKVEEGSDVIATARATGRILQVGSQRTSSILYGKAKELLEAGAVGEMNLIEAWINRNSALGAWQYSIPPDASPETVDWDRFLGHAPRRPFDPARLFRWRNYQDYGTGVAGDLFVHLFSGIHYVLGSTGPTRIMTTGGLRYWHDGRDVPDVMLGLFDYPKTASHPEFTLLLKVNFADGSATETSGFRFAGPEGVVSLAGGSVSLSRRERPSEPGFTIDTFPEAVQEAFLRHYREQYPESEPALRPAAEETYLAPPGYNDTVEHFRNFFQAVRTRQPVLQDATFGLRAAGPAVLSNTSYFEHGPVAWDPETMTMPGHGGTSK